MTPKRKNKNYVWIGGIAGFLLGICGNLVAAWIQQDIVNNSFTPQRIGLIILCSLSGIVVMTILEAKTSTSREKTTSRDAKNSYSRIKLAWSKLRTRGKDIKMDEVSSIGSDIDIDTK